MFSVYADFILFVSWR